MQRMYEEKRLQMERGSIGGSYFMVQLPDGTMEKRMKMPINADPGVHSSLALDQLAAQQAGLQTVATLPTITEAKPIEQNGSHDENGIEIKKRPPRVSRHSESDTQDYNPKNIPRNASQPAFSAQVQGIPKNGSVPTFDRMRKGSASDRYKPSLAAIRASSRTEVGAQTTGSNGDVRNTDMVKSSSLGSLREKRYSIDEVSKIKIFSYKFICWKEGNYQINNIRFLNKIII